MIRFCPHDLLDISFIDAVSFSATDMRTDSAERKGGLDWKEFLREDMAARREELSLTELKPGDRVLLHTRNSKYAFTWETPDRAMMRASSEKAPSGLVRIMGCSFGLSSSIRPDAIFCGGNLEYAHGERTWTTSEIGEIYLLSFSTATKKDTL